MFGISAGIANSFLDTGTYPALMEAYPKKAASANIIVKAFCTIWSIPFTVYDCIYFGK